MLTISEVGGVRVFGKEEIAWSSADNRRIGSSLAVFDSDVYSPDTEMSSGTPHFVLPCHRGKKGYEIHLTESDEAFVLKEGRVYLCTHHDGKPRVLTYTPVPADRQEASMR